MRCKYILALMKLIEICFDGLQKKLKVNITDVHIWYFDKNSDYLSILFYFKTKILKCNVWPFLLFEDSREQ